MYNSKIINLYNEFTKSLKNLKNKSIEEVTNFYSSGKDIIDFGTIYYYLKTNSNRGFAGKYPKKFSKITKNGGNRYG